MLEENDYESQRIHIERYIKGKPHGQLIWKSIQNGPTPHPQTTDPAPEGGAVPPPRNKRDEEFTKEDNINELSNIQAINILSSGQILERRKEALFDEFERFRANGNELIQDYFVRFYKLVNDIKVTQLDIPTHQLNTNFANNLPLYWGKYVTHAKNNMNMSTVTYVELFTHLRTYKEHALKSLKKKEQSSAVVDPLTYLAKTTPTHSTTSPVTVPTPQSSGDSHNDAMLATMNKIANLLSVQRRAPGNTGTKGIQTTGSANHEDAYDSDMDEGPHASAAFMANLSSTGGTNGSSSSHINEEEHLNFKVDLVLDDNMITYDEYQNDFGVKAVPTVLSANEADKQSMIAILQRMHIEIAGYVRVNDEHKLVNETLTAELERCKIEMQALERNKVKHDLDMAIVERNNRNAKLEEENKTLEDKYLEEIVVLTNANKVSINVLKGFQMATHTILMLSKRPNFTSHDLHKTGLGYSNPRYCKQFLIAQPALYDGNVLLNPNHPPTRVHDSEESLVHAEVCKIKMAERLGYALPINYAKLNALYDQFVPQKELSREQFYWLPAAKIAS
nr:hypothetical protein [Tanacetum cinerariifolium]